MTLYQEVEEYIVALRHLQQALDDAFQQEQWQQVMELDQQCQDLLSGLNVQGWRNHPLLPELKIQVNAMLVSYRVLLTEAIFRQRKLGCMMQSLEAKKQAAA